MEYTYKTRGTCSRQIKFDLVDGKVSNVSFVGGCNGNLQGISLLVEGMEASKVIEILKENSEKVDYCIDFLMIAKYLERVGDHAVNICEWLEFNQTGTVNQHRLI